jgi:hypothetical protein
MATQRDRPIVRKPANVADNHAPIFPPEFQQVDSVVRTRPSECEYFLSGRTDSAHMPELAVAYEFAVRDCKVSAIANRERVGWPDSPLDKREEANEGGRHRNQQY